MPSVLSLAQGLGQDPGCHNETYVNSTNNQTYIVLEQIPITPIYSVQLYFIFMFMILVISTISFSLLNFSNTAISTRKPSAISFFESNKRKRISPSMNTSDNDPIDIKSNSDDSLITESKHELSSESHAINLENNVISVKNEQIILLTYVFFLSFM